LIHLDFVLVPIVAQKSLDTVFFDVFGRIHPDTSFKMVDLIESTKILVGLTVRRTYTSRRQNNKNARSNISLTDENGKCELGRPFKSHGIQTTDMVEKFEVNG
jgi:hypothetical protein